MANSAWQGTMPNKASQVVELQDRVSPYQNKHGFLESGAFENIITRLELLRKQVLATEQTFYAQFRLSSGTQGLMELQARLDQANQDIGFRSMVNISDSEFDNLVYQALSNIDLEKPITLTFNQDPQALMTLSKEPINALLEDLESMRQMTIDFGEGSIKTSRMNKSSTGSRGLSKFIKEVGTVEIDPITAKKRVKVTLKETLGPSWQKRLEHNYNLILDSGTTREEIIRRWLQQRITSPLLNQCVMYQFEQNKNKYDLNGSIASIKGFLGEVHANAFLDFLCGAPGTSNPLGNAREIIKGRRGGEIPIDLLFKGYGFQVKNYRIIDGYADFSTHRTKMGMGNFIMERMRPETDLASLLIDFYGSWAFNQPIDEPQGEKYQPIYNRFESKSLDSLFEGYIDNILRVSDEFQANVAEFTNMGLYYNTFFIIGDKIVPSSSILSAIISQLKTNNKVHFITSSFNITPPEGGNPVWQLDKPKTEVSAYTLATRVKIEYSIALEIRKILEAAYTDSFNF